MKLIRPLATAAFVALAALGSAAQAGDNVFFSLGVEAAPGVTLGVTNARPVVVTPAPVYVAPRRSTWRRARCTWRRSRWWWLPPGALPPPGQAQGLAQEAPQAPQAPSPPRSRLNWMRRGVVATTDDRFSKRIGPGPQAGAFLDPLARRVLTPSRVSRMRRGRAAPLIPCRRP